MLKTVTKKSKETGKNHVVVYVPATNVTLPLLEPHKPPTSPRMHRLHAIESSHWFFEELGATRVALGTAKGCRKTHCVAGFCQDLALHFHHIQADVDGGRRHLVRPQLAQKHCLASSVKVNKRDPSSRRSPSSRSSGIVRSHVARRQHPARTSVRRDLTVFVHPLHRCCLLVFSFFWI